MHIGGGPNWHPHYVSLETIATQKAYDSSSFLVLVGSLETTATQKASTIKRHQSSNQQFSVQFEHRFGWWRVQTTIVAAL
jgi:hypothetical protein